MTKHKTAAATIGDLDRAFARIDAKLARSILTHKAGMEALGQKFLHSREDIWNKFEHAVREMKLHFDVSNERFASDLRAINTDKMNDHEARIIHLEVINRVR